MPKISRRHPAAIALVLMLSLFVTGAAYSALAPEPARAATADASDVRQGKKLFTANCANCHGKNGLGIDELGPSLAGVGAASVDFQMGTGRMPMAGPDVQAPGDIRVKFSQEEISDIAAYVATLGPGPAIPDEKWTNWKKGDPGRGGEIFRVNCAMCHHSTGNGGALTRGKSAPALSEASPKHIYEAMATGPQSMPVYNSENLSPKDKRDVIAYIKAQQAAGNPGGNPLGGFGPVPEGLFAWTIGLGMLVTAAVWLGAKSS